ncbi:MAG: GAF domain-containing protein [Deltaproteobacteria bacterium]|nr:GAF domain-containing protein [Deltaproteobacteria bacterium]
MRKPRSLLRPTIHGGGQARVSALGEAVQRAIRPLPIMRLLDEAPRAIAKVFGSDVCSIYLREARDVLVLRGNVGFPDTALGHVRLALGEGIVGTAVEVMKPISLATAGAHRSYRHFPGLGEERFPVFCAVPLLGAHGPLGALSVQRRGKEAYSDADVELLVALSGVLSLRIMHSEQEDLTQERRRVRRAPMKRHITLPGSPVVHGVGIGALHMLDRPSGLGASAAIPGDAARLERAFAIARRRVEKLHLRAKHIGADTLPFVTFRQIVDDARLRERTGELLDSGMPLRSALHTVAREAVRAGQRDAFMAARARDIEDFVDAVTMLSQYDARERLPAKPVLVVDDFGLFELLVAPQAPIAACIVRRSAEDPRRRSLLSLLNAPVLSDVAGLFRWAEAGDVAIVDAVHGLVVLNPSRSEVSALRVRARKKK